MTPREELAARLDSARRRKNLSIRAVARLVDVPAATVQGWLSGKHAPTPALRPQFERLVRALGLEGEVQPEWLDVDRALGTLRSGDTPYVGLRPYATTEERIFFGRDAEAARIATAVRRHAPNHGLVALVGPSGSGKSSLLAAGLVGRHCAPGGLLEHRRGRVLTVRDLATHLDTGDADLVVLDQFEELLDLGEDRDPTLAAVLDLATRATVVLGIRSDAYGRLAELSDLRDALERPILVQPMAPEEIRQAITGPAALRDVEVDPGLVELVLADTGAAEDPQATLTLLPLVSHALLMTWGAGSGQRMTVDDYRRAGGLSSAVENLADGIVASLSTEQRRTARALFMRMVGLLDDRAVRRPVALASLSAATLAVARPFVDARVLSTTETQLHISHDSVLRHWPRLADWIEDGREQLRVREHLSRATRLWVDSGRSPDGLIPVDRLPMFAGLGLDDSTDLLSPLEDEFLTESRAHFTSQLAQERRTSARLRRGRALAFGLTALTLALALVATGAFLQTRRVQLDAQSRQVAIQASALQARDPNLYAQLALVSAALAPTREARSSLLVATSLDVPTRWTAPGSSFATTGPGGSVVQVDGAGGVALWRADTIYGPPDVRFTADPAGGQLFAVALTRAEDRLLLLTGGAGGYRALWDVTDEPTTLADLGGAGTLFGAAFDPTGPRFALAHSDGTTSTVELWHLDRLAGPQRLGAQTFDGQVSALAFTPDGGRVLTAGTRDHIGVWTVTASGLEPADPIPLGADPGIRALSLAISPDGSSLAAGLTSGQVATWPLDGAGTTPPRLTSVSSFWINGVAFSGDGSQLLTGDSEQRLHVWASDTMEHLRGIRAPAIVQSVAWAGPEPMATLVDGTLLHWGERSSVLRSEGGRIYYLAADAAGADWLVGTDQADAVVELWGRPGNDRRLRLPFPEGLAPSVATAMTPAGDRVVAGTTDGQVVVWDVAGPAPGAPRTSRIADDGNLVAIDVSPDGTLLAAGLYNGHGTVLARIGADLSVTPLATLPSEVPQLATFSPDGRYLQVGIAAGAVDLWDVSDPEHPIATASLPTPSNPGASAFSSTGRLLAAGTDGGDVLLWDWTDPARPQELRRLLGPRAGINTIAFSPDASLLVAAGVGDYLWVWDLTEDSTAAVLSVPAAMGSVHDVQFLAGGALIAATGATGEVRLWGTDPDAERPVLCALRGEPLTDDEWERYLPGIPRIDPCSDR